MNKKWLPVLSLTSVIWLCMGASVDDLPPFRMEEFEDTGTSIFDRDAEIPDVDVPRVSERVYGAEELIRFPVTEVVIEGIVPYPEMGITQESVQAVIDQQLEIEKDIELDENGFSSRDLKEIGAFLREMIDRRGWDEEDLDNLVELVVEQDLQQGWITIPQLDAIALAVTEFYREKGFILATAFVPEQEVADSVIRLNVLEGRLGNVTVSSNNIFAEETISAAFKNEIGEAVTEERVESALRRINDLPGVRVRGSFSPGQNVGETSLNLGVLEEKAWNSALLIDNHGSDTTGKTRVFATAEWLNMRNRGHRFLLGALRSEGPDSSLYGVLEYEMPVTNDGRGKLKATLSSNEFSVGETQALPEIVGETDNYVIEGSYQYLRSRSRNLSAQASYTYKDVLFSVGEIASLSTDQEIESLSVSAEYTRLWDEQQLLLTTRLGLDQGHVKSGAALNQSTDFTKTLLNVNMLKRFSVFNWLTKEESDFNVVFKANAQYSEKFLSSVEQFSLGGPGAVRAFSVSDVSVDSGAYAGLEVFFDMPIDPIGRFNLPLSPLKPFVFFDYGYGVARVPGGGINRDAQIKGYGLGFRVDWPGKGVANFVFAKPRSAVFDDDFIEDVGKSRVYFDLLYQIH